MSGFRLALVSALVVICAVSGSRPAATEPLDSAVVERAEQVCFSTLVHATGFVVPRTAAVVMFNAPGFRVTEVSATEGDRVAQGQQLAAVAPRDPQAAAPGTPGRIILKATASGLVLRSTAKIGLALSASSEPLFTIIVGGRTEVMAEIPGMHVPELRAGQPARVTIASGHEVRAHVRLVPAEVNSATQMGLARLSFDTFVDMPVGTFTRVVVDAERSCGIAVPKSALAHTSAGVSVQVVRDGAIETRRVHLGLLSDSQAEIKEGVEEGELVVANAGTSFRDGDQVQPLSPALEKVR